MSEQQSKILDEAITVIKGNPAAGLQFLSGACAGYAAGYNAAKQEVMTDDRKNDCQQCRSGNAEGRDADHGCQPA